MQLFERWYPLLDRSYFIGPPFGHYWRHTDAYSVDGSYTRFPRDYWRTQGSGRLRQTLRTVRPLGRDMQGNPKGWLNQIGLRNPGIKSVAQPIWEPHQICSIAIIDGDADEWDWLAEFLTFGPGIYLRNIEINVSCPNTGHPTPMLPDNDMTIRAIQKAMLPNNIIWKLPPVPTITNTAMRLADQGAKYLHLSNTYPTPAGGISGPLLREINLPLVERTAAALSAGNYETEIIGGGGIYYISNVTQYRSAGAVKFAISSAFFKPGRGMRIINNRLPGS